MLRFRLFASFVLLLACAGMGAGGQQLAIMPLSFHGIDSAEAAIVTDALVNGYLRSTNADLMERQQINAVLAEQGFEQSGACDASECAVKAGKLLGIRQIVVGSVGRLGGSFMLNLRRVDVSTGRLLATSSRSRKGAIDEVLQGLVSDAVADLSNGDRPAEVTVPVAVRPVVSASVPGSTVPARSARVQELDLPAVILELGPDRASRVGDVFLFTDSAGRDTGWVRLVSRADDPSIGGAGRAAAGSIAPPPGAILRKLPQSPWSFEFRMGQQLDIENKRSDWASEEFFSYSIVDLAAVAWYRPRLASHLWLGLGGVLNVNESYRYSTSWSYQTNSSVTERSNCDDGSGCSGDDIDFIKGGIAAVRLGFNVSGRLGWFLQTGLSITARSNWNQFLASRTALGFTWAATPSLSVQTGLGFDVETTSGSSLKRPGYGVSLVWTPGASD